MHRRSALSCLALAGWAPTAGQTQEGAAAQVEWQPPVAVDQGAGERGRWQQNESRYDFVDDLAVALAPDGAAALAWVDQKRKAVLMRWLDADGRWAQPEPLDVSRQPATFSWLPRVALAPDAPGHVVVLWQEIIFSGGAHGGEMMVARSLDGGRRFGPPLNLSRSQAGDGKGRVTRERWHNGSQALVTGTGGAVHAAWTTYDGALWASRSVDGGASFSPPRQVAAHARAPSLALWPGERLYLAWAGVAPGARGVHLAASANGGASFGPVRRVAAAGPVDAPRLALGPGGVLHLVFAEGRAGAQAPQVVRHVRSFDGGRRFEAARTLSPPRPPGTAGAGFAQLGIDGRGRVVAAWEVFERLDGPPRGLAYAVSLDGGQRFMPAAMVPHSVDPGGGWNGSSQGLLGQKLAVNEAGDIALACSALRPGAHSRVWLLRGRLAA